ncbi:cysteine hydrolase family protein [Cellulomonas soli]|uniref:Isochorismatase n=1 Tax=Cellulomonas soli TaxID=931535 RepID=A0A512PHJ6_9CELL|nr:isochorismatase family cysteine hydrolase [Cellulomonas soli]NYI59183.1 nicotinamidase-related amidase [Cellulomonas soli]GEP70688.1 isochorismatase [Cellulomonas soli]
MSEPLVGPGGLVAADGSAWALPGPVEQGAVVVIDVQRSFADPAFLPWVGAAGLEAVAAAVATTARLVAGAREQGVPVVWVALEQDPSEPWDTSLWLRRVPADAVWPGADEPCVAGTPGAQWFGVAPEPAETVVRKTRYSGFVGTTLATELQAAGVTWFVAAGLTTECCVGSTVWDGFQRGWRTVVASDATAAYDPDVHTTTLRVLAENAAVVATTDALLDAFAAARHAVAVPA